MNELDEIETSDLKAKLRVVPGFPKKGVNYIDITTLLKEPSAFKRTIDWMTIPLSKRKVDLIVGIDVRPKPLQNSVIAQSATARRVPVENLEQRVVGPPGQGGVQRRRVVLGLRQRCGRRQ